MSERVERERAIFALSERVERERERESRDRERYMCILRKRE